MPREENSNVLFYCQSNAAITPVYTCKTYIFGKWNYGIRSAGYAFPPLGVPADLQSAVKKCGGVI